MCVASCIVWCVAYVNVCSSASVGDVCLQPSSFCLEPVCETLGKILIFSNPILGVPDCDRGVHMTSQRLEANNRFLTRSKGQVVRWKTTRLTIDQTDGPVGSTQNGWHGNASELARSISLTHTRTPPRHSKHKRAKRNRRPEGHGYNPVTIPFVMLFVVPHHPCMCTLHSPSFYHLVSCIVLARVSRLRCEQLVVFMTESILRVLWDIIGCVCVCVCDVCQIS